MKIYLGVLFLLGCCIVCGTGGCANITILSFSFYIRLGNKRKWRNKRKWWTIVPYDYILFWDFKQIKMVTWKLCVIFNPGQTLPGLLVWLAHVVVRGLITADLILEPCSCHGQIFGVVENGDHLESSCNFIINSL